MRALILFLFVVSTPASPIYAMSLLSPESAQHTADQDAQAAYRQSDKRLIGISTRGVSVPGVDADKIEVSKQRCGLRIIRRSDVIRSSDELEARRNQAEYIEAYNRAMFSLCWLND